MTSSEDEMSPHSLLLALPTEIRMEIWRYLLCPYDTVNLHLDFDLLSDMAKKGSQKTKMNKEKGGDKIDKYARAIRSTPTLPVSILRVNQQLHTESSFLLYRNRLHFHVSPPVVMHFLNLRSSRNRAHIRHLGFGWEATSSMDIEVPTGWHKIHKYLVAELTIETVTIWVPRIETDTAWTPYEPQFVDAEWFFWPAVEGLIRMLLDGDIKSVRLLFANLSLDFEHEEVTAPVWELITLPKDEVVEKLFVVDRLLYSGMGTEEKDAIRKRRLPLKVERVDGVGGFARWSEIDNEYGDGRDVGSVVVLTKEG